jgi:ubiquinone/menaquinone biosynthesis C-methylase UbiE
MAKAYPNNKFIGFDYHRPSIDIARRRAKEEGLTEDTISFEVASSTDFPSRDDGYDLVVLTYMIWVIPLVLPHMYYRH